MDSHHIERILSEVRRAFPFRDYLGEMAAHDYLGRVIANQLLPAQRGKILDIGAGPCDKTSVFALMGYTCEACDDFNDPWHRTGDNLDRIRAFARKMNVVLHEGKAEEIVPGLGSFDLVILNDVIEHLFESPRDLLNVAISCLRPSGFLLVSMPNSVNLRKRLSVVTGRTNYPPARQFFDCTGIWRGHVREWTPRETGDLLRWMGLESVRVETYHGMLARRIATPFFRLFYRGFTSILPNLRDSICAWGTKPEGWGPVRPPNIPPAVLPK